MKKIGIVTIHNSSSYGGTLQALATQEICSKYGDAYIIDYRQPAITSTLKLFRFSKSRRVFLHLAKDLFRLLPRAKLIESFKAFTKEFYNLTDNCRNLKEFSEVSENYGFDYLVSGSDQIWNPKILGRLDPVYFLDVATSAKKVSISSSRGNHAYTDVESKYVKEKLSGFDMLSVREGDTKLLLEKEFGLKNIFNSLDPTLLMSKKEWIEKLNLTAPSRPKYILVFTLKKDKLVTDSVVSLGRILDLPIVVVDQDPFLPFECDEHIRSASPRDFLNLVLGAEYVITNSFHGVAFSVNFGKRFVALKPESGFNRVVSLLKSIGIENVYLDKSDFFQGSEVFNIDVDKVQDNLERLRRENLDFYSSYFGENNDHS